MKACATGHGCSPRTETFSPMSDSFSPGMEDIESGGLRGWSLMAMMEIMSVMIDDDDFVFAIPLERAFSRCLKLIEMLPRLNFSRSAVMDSL